MARLRVSRGTNEKITALNTNKNAQDGTLYVSTDNGLTYMGTSSGTLLQLKDGIDHNTTYSDATQSASGLLSSSDKKKLDGIAPGAQVNSITGVKGDAESSYRTGNVNITPANIGAATSGHNHDSTYLKLAGGTMSGDIVFAPTGTTGKSNKIFFSGSTDTASIYYNVLASDQGNLVFDMGDDSNAYIQFASSGTVSSYISPSDGVYHGKATSAGSADSATSASTATKLATARSLQTNLGSTAAVTFDGSNNQTNIPITGTLAIDHGGTGLTASPSMLINLGSTSADNVLQTSPRPGVTGTLPVSNGGTGATTADNARTNLGAAPSDIVLVQSTQPSSTTCKLWIKV